VDRFVSILKSSGVVEPGGAIPGDPVILRALRFPTVTLCEQMNLPSAVVQRVSGRQEFEKATIRRADLQGARLEHSVWHGCRFEDVRFDEAKLQSARFFGCRFSGCTFHSTDLKNASFALDRKGNETVIEKSTLVDTSFKGASCQKPVFDDVTFTSCVLKGFVFDEGQFTRVRFQGDYPELTFRGSPGDQDRNLLEVDLRQARIGWFNANHGVDLSRLVPPLDGSLFVLLDRRRAIEVLSTEMIQRAPWAEKLVVNLRSLYSHRSLSPLSDDQTTFALTPTVIAECGEGQTKEQISEIYRAIRDLAETKGLLAKLPSGV
jgi:uncharacterized protein YjbI with pentapeptide repeats